jgi:HSP20 family protein
MLVRRFFGSPTGEWETPFEEMERLRQNLSRVLEASPRTGDLEPSCGVFPLTNITQDEDSFYLRAELPGIKAGDVDISVTANSISISGERGIPAENEEVKYHRRERESGSFRRMVKLPAAIDTSKVEASGRDGVLTVVMPKAETAKPKRITVKTS